MEIKLIDVYVKETEKTNLSITCGEIYGTNSLELLNLMRFDAKLLHGKIIFNDIELTKENVKSIENDISIIDGKNISFLTSTVKEEIKYEYIKRKQNYKKNFDYIFDKFNMFGFDNSFINKKISYLSDSEKYLFNILKNILFLPKVIIFENIFTSLDRNNKKRLTSIINQLKERNIIIFVITSDVDILYSLTTKVLLLNDRKVVNGNTKSVFTDVNYLLTNNFEIPTLPLITYEAKNRKGVKLFYHDDVRDIIKDIYKHV